MSQFWAGVTVQAYFIIVKELNLKGEKMKSLRMVCLWFGMLAMVSLFPSIGFGADWTWENPLPQGNSFDDVWGNSESDVFAVGNYGTIFHYDGNTWTQMDSGTTQNLYGVWGSSGSDVFAVGHSGTILHFNGSVWSQMDSGTTSKLLLGVWGTSGSNIFVVGESGLILHYNGNTWSEMSSGTDYYLRGVWGASGTDIFAVGSSDSDGKILHYDGNVWSEMAIGTTDGLCSVWGTSGSDVFVGGWFGALLHYDGVAWSLMDSGGDEDIRDVWGTSGSDVFAVGGKWLEGTARIIHYDGSTWSEVASDATEYIRGVWGNSGTDIFAVSEYGTILHYEGTTWSKMTSGYTGGFGGVWGSTGTDVFAVGYSGTIFHYDGSAWLPMDSGTTENIYGVWAASGSDVFAVGYSGTILHYDGNTWSQMNSGTWESLEGVWGSSGTDVFAVGGFSSGKILHYDGSEWSEMASGTSSMLIDVWGSTGSDVFAVGLNGTILHYDGASWSPMVSGTTERLEDVWGSSGSDVYAVGWSAVLHYNGSAWSEVNIGSDVPVLSVWGSSSSDVYIAGFSGVIFHYDGSVWSEMASGTTNYFNSVWGASGADIFAVGNGGAILHYDRVGIPEMNLRQDTTTIPDGGKYDFGNVVLGTDTPIDKVFTISNIGGGNLNLTTPLTVTGDDADQFSIEAQPASDVASKSQTTFTVRFNPTSAGAKSAAIHIANNDADEAPYDLTLTGNVAQSASLISPTPYTDLAGTTQTFTWTDSNADQYWLWVGTSLGGSDLYSADQGTNTSTSVVGLPYKGETLFVRLWSKVFGEWQFNDYTYTAFDYTSVWAVIHTPPFGSVLESRTVKFCWNDSGADQYWLQVGKSLGGADLYSADQGTDICASAPGLPHNSETVYVRLWQKAFGDWFYDDYTYTAFNDGAAIGNWEDGAVLDDATITFTWNNSGADQYWVQVGTSKGGKDIYSADHGTDFSATIDVQKHNGETVCVRLWSKQDGDWIYRDYVYTAHNDAATMISPVSGADLSSTTQTFTWNDAGADQYWLWIGKSAGGKDVYSADQGTDTSVIVNGLPFEGELLYVRLWSHISGDWIYNDYMYTAYDYNASRASVTSPTPGSTLDCGPVTFEWNDSGADQYWLWIGLSLGGSDLYSADQGIATSAVVPDLPHNGQTIYVRLWQHDYGKWSYKDDIYTACNNSLEIISPAPGSTLDSRTVTFVIDCSGGEECWIYLGTYMGGKDLYSGIMPSNCSVTVSDLPFNGETIYLRLLCKIDGDWIFNDYTYTACNKAAVINNPTPGSTLDSTTATFAWNDAGADQYWLYVGFTKGGKEIYEGDQGANTSGTVTDLPFNGETLYVRLWTKIYGDWIFNDYTYTACDKAAIINDPTPGSTLDSTMATFTWNNAGASQYWLFVGTSEGANDLYSGDQGTNTSATVSQLPHGGETLNVRLWSEIDGQWLYNDHTYTAWNDGAVIVNPTQGSTLTSTTVTFTWADVNADQYWLQVGTTQGGSDLYSADQGRNTAATVTGLPHNGETIHVRLWSKMYGDWIYNDHTFTAINDAAVITDPTPGSTLDSMFTDFAWTDAGADQYWLYIGTVVGGNDLYSADQGIEISATVWGLPHNGETVYVRLWSLIDGDWIFNDYTYTARSL